MYQANTRPRGRAVAAAVTVDIDSDYKAPVQYLQNNGEVDANVVFNGGVAFVVKASETLRFDPPLLGEITSDQDLVALA